MSSYTTNDYIEAMSEVERWEALGAQGINVSVCYGPSGESRELIWSVTALFPDGSQIDPPFAAHSLAHAIQVAEKETRLRGWLPLEAA